MFGKGYSLKGELATYRFIYLIYIFSPMNPVQKRLEKKKAVELAKAGGKGVAGTMVVIKSTPAPGVAAKRIIRRCLFLPRIKGLITSRLLLMLEKVEGCF